MVKMNRRFFIVTSAVVQVSIAVSVDLLTNNTVLMTGGVYMPMILVILVLIACVVNLWLVITLVNFADKYNRAYDSLTQSIRKGDGYEI